MFFYSESWKHIWTMSCWAEHHWRVSSATGRRVSSVTDSRVGSITGWRVSSVIGTYYLWQITTYLNSMYKTRLSWVTEKVQSTLQQNGKDMIYGNSVHWVCSLHRWSSDEKLFPSVASASSRNSQKFIKNCTPLRSTVRLNLAVFSVLISNYPMMQVSSHKTLWEPGDNLIIQHRRFCSASTWDTSHWFFKKFLLLHKGTVACQANIPRNKMVRNAKCQARPKQYTYRSKGEAPIVQICW